MLISSPLEQFSIVNFLQIDLLGFNISITNSTIFLIFSIFVCYSILYLCTYNPTVAPNNWQYVAETLYEFVFNTSGAQNIKEIREYFPFIFTLFVFILTNNLIGMVPYTFTITSHLFVTFTLGFTVWVGVTFVGFARHGLHFFSLFCPAGIPLVMVPALILIEIVSYVFRAISISVRLFANVMAGHALFAILSGFGWAMVSTGILGCFGCFSIFAFLFAFTGLEIAIAFIQAYIFTLLTCIYLKDSILLH